MARAAIFFANGLEECEGLVTVDILRRAGVKVDIAAVGGSLTITSSHKVTITCDKLAEDLDASRYDAAILPGGLPGGESSDDRPSRKRRPHRRLRSNHAGRYGRRADHAARHETSRCRRLRPFGEIPSACGVMLAKSLRRIENLHNILPPGFHLLATATSTPRTLSMMKMSPTSPTATV